MQAIKAVYDGINFRPKQPIPVHGHYDVVITFIEPIVPDKLMDLTGREEENARIDWLNRIESALELTDDEDLSDFPSQGLMKATYDDWLS